MSDFDKAINRLLGNEGGLSDNPHDPGGVTNWGISQRSYPHLDIRALTKEQAMALYKRDFWDRIGGDDLPLGIGYQLLDFAVNSGSGTAVRALQRALNCADDGHFGPVSLAALKVIEPHNLIMTFLAERLVFMTNCVAWTMASKGWARRIAANLKYASQDI